MCVNGLAVDTAKWSAVKYGEYQEHNGALNFTFLCLFVKLQKKEATISFVMSVRLHGTTRLPIDGFISNFIFQYFSKMSTKLMLY
jgi:hypothetical protein